MSKGHYKNKFNTFVEYLGLDASEEEGFNIRLKEFVNDNIADDTFKEKFIEGTKFSFASVFKVEVLTAIFMADYLIKNELLGYKDESEEKTNPDDVIINEQKIETYNRFISSKGLQFNSEGKIVLSKAKLKQIKTDKKGERDFADVKIFKSGENKMVVGIDTKLKITEKKNANLSQTNSFLKELRVEKQNFYFIFIGNEGGIENLGLYNYIKINYETVSATAGTTAKLGSQFLSDRYLKDTDINNIDIKKQIEIIELRKDVFNKYFKDLDTTRKQIIEKASKGNKTHIQTVKQLKTLLGDDEENMMENITKQSILYGQDTNFLDKISFKTSTGNVQAVTEGKIIQVVKNILNYQPETDFTDEDKNELETLKKELEKQKKETIRAVKTFTEAPIDEQVRKVKEDKRRAVGVMEEELTGKEQLIIKLKKMLEEERLSGQAGLVSQEAIFGAREELMREQIRDRENFLIEQNNILRNELTTAINSGDYTYPISLRLENNEIELRRVQEDRRAIMDDVIRNVIEQRRQNAEDGLNQL
jgi:hypothetical protein